MSALYLFHGIWLCCIFWDHIVSCYQLCSFTSKLPWFFRLLWFLTRFRIFFYVCGKCLWNFDGGENCLILSTIHFLATFFFWVYLIGKYVSGSWFYIWDPSECICSPDSPNGPMCTWLSATSSDCAPLRTSSRCWCLLRLVDGELCESSYLLYHKKYV